MHRPQFHFTPPQNWMNDPNGLIHWKGTYHLFYQHNPGAAVWGDMHWGHATGTDLVHWEHQPVALAPDSNGPDRDGCFSGVAIPVGDRVALMYTGVRGDDQLPCLAWAVDDAFSSFEKHPANPVIPATPESLSLTMYRDHSVWREDNGWRQLVGAGIEDVGGAVLLYESGDLVEWTFLGRMLAEDTVLGANAPQPLLDARYQTNGWECPDFFPIGALHVLTYSLWGKEFSGVGSYVGSFDGTLFTPTRFALVDHGWSFYAPQSFTDELGRRVLIGWLREECSEAMQVERGWSGAMSISRVIGADAHGRMTQTPAPEIEAIRGAAVAFEVGPSLESQRIDLGSIDVNDSEISSTWVSAADLEATWTIRHSVDDSEFTTISLSTSTLTVDTTRSSELDGAPGGVFTAPIDLDSDEQVNVRIFVDVSVIEVFVNDRTVVTARVYPAASGPGALELTSTISGSTTIWQMG